MPKPNKPDAPNKDPNAEHYREITVSLSHTVCALLACLDDDGSVENVLEKLADHAQQGVYRPGAWEREWLIQAFSDEFEDRLEPGDPYGREDCDLIFRRPRGATIQG